MPPRKRIDPKTVLYDVDAAHARRVLGEPGDPKTHLPKLLARVKMKNADFLAVLIDTARIEFPAEEFEREKDKLNLQNAEFISLLFEGASTLNERDEARDRAVGEAFRAANLDIRNPMSWRLLMELFCWTHFGEKGKPGKSVFWTDDKYCELLGHVHRVKTEKGITEDKRACDEVLEQFGKKYRTISVGRLVKALREARDHHYNLKLAKPVWEAMEREIEARQKEGKPPFGIDCEALERRCADRLGAEWRTAAKGKEN